MKKRLILIISLITSMGVVSPVFSKSNEDTQTDLSVITPSITENEILSRSQISYKALGRSQGLHTYSVVISCVDGNISTLKTLFRPGTGPDPEPVRQVGILNKEAYLGLWNLIQDKRLFEQDKEVEISNPSSSSPSIHLFASVGEDSFKFFSEDLNSPQAAVFKTVHNAINSTVDMNGLFDALPATARR